MRHGKRKIEKMRSLKFFALIIVVLIVGGTVALATKAQDAPRANLPTDPRDPLLNQGPKKVAVGDKVMVSTQLPIVTDAALQVLRHGGNAIDAYITAVLMQTVNDYHQVSLFGMMAGLYYDAATGKYFTL